MGWSGINGFHLANNGQPSQNIGEPEVPLRTYIFFTDSPRHLHEVAQLAKKFNARINACLKEALNENPDG
jgi:3'-phosphoadenosine 5'-phosphosulfate sulfotransferase (PAPS reductase)/FAD synthetase